MRIAIGQLWQETNTLNPNPTTKDDFLQFGVSRGAEMVDQMAHTNELGGFIQSLQAWPEKPEIVGLLRLPAWPGGRATAETYDWLQEELLSALTASLPVDAVLLALHGAMAAGKHPDVEGDILAAMRALIGDDIPLVATLDLHTNLTPKMIAAADALAIYHSAPHVDVYETGERGAALLRRILIDGARPVTAFQKIPIVLPPERANTEANSGVSVDLKKQLQELESCDEILSAGLATVQPWMDVPELGSAVFITTDNREDRAKQACTSLANELWRRREEYLPELVEIEPAVRQAHALSQGLTVLSDAADATTSGAPGDSVWILQELLKYDWPRPVLLTLVSSEVVGQAEQLGEGGQFSGNVGGVLDHRFGTKLAITANVERLFDARFIINGHLGKNMPIDMGPCALLRTGNIFIIVTSRNGPHFAPELFQTAGLDPFAAAVLIAKSPCGFRAVYADQAAQIFSVKTPGCAPSDFWNYQFDRRPRPLWPWEEIDHWTADPIVLTSR